MTACRLTSYAVPDHPFANITRAETRCDTHQWHGAGILVTPNGAHDAMCPIGRIEAALEHALACIEERLEELEKKNCTGV